MSGRIIVGGLVLFALVFGAALWWFQTRGYLTEVTGVEAVEIAGARVPVEGYRGIDANTSPLRMRGCFMVAEPVIAPAALDATPLTTPGWFDCFDAARLTEDLAAGEARALRAEENQPYGFDRIVAIYPDGRAFQWRQMNICGKAKAAGDPLPDTCPQPTE